jgi:hypothetical protein
MDERIAEAPRRLIEETFSQVEQPDPRGALITWTPIPTISWQDNLMLDPIRTMELPFVRSLDWDSLTRDFLDDNEEPS